MPETLKHRPFAGLERAKPEVTVIRRRTTDPESGLSLVRQIRVTPSPEGPPPNARLTPDPTEPDEVAAKKKPGSAKGYKRSPESIEKQKATLAKKKRSKKRLQKVSMGKGDKAAFVRANPSVGAPELVKLAAKQGISFTAQHVYNVRAKDRGKAPTANGPKSNGATLGELLQTIVDVTAEIQRRLSQVAL